MIAVHCGAGKHSSENHKKYNRLCNRACREGVKVLKNGGTPLEAVKVAVTILENDSMTNAGYGSNLTINGHVECDAAVMDGKTLVYGGCGAVRKVKNPIELAYDICVKQYEDNIYGLVAPSLLVGSGALEHARKNGLRIVENKDLVSRKALKQMTKYKAMTEKNDVSQRLDTVGAVCCGTNGTVAAASSSGGLILKKDGRVGQAALYASGVWADSYSSPREASLAVCTTGCGEQLVQTQLAKQIAEDLKDCDFPTVELSKCITEKFVNSKFLHRATVKSAGALVVHVSGGGEGSVLWGHNTETMSVGFMRCTDVKSSSLVSQLKSNVSNGETSLVMVGGSNFQLDLG